MKHLTLPLLAVALAPLACGSPAKQTITIGGVLDTTGTLSNYGLEELEAAKLAIDEINAAGGVLGANLAIDNRDTAFVESQAVNAAKALVEAKVPAIIGSIASGITLAVSKVTIPANVLLVSGASTSPAITTVDDNGYVFRTCPSDAPQGKLIAQRAKAKGFNKVAVLYVPGAFGKGLADSFSAAFTAGGGTVTDSLEYVEAKSSYSDVLTTIYAKQPQAVVLVAYPVDGAQIIKDYRSAPPASGLFWYFTNGLVDTGFVTGVGASNFTFQHEGTSPSTASGPTWEAYKAAFKAKYSRDPNSGSYSPQIYDAVYVLALAMESAGKAEAPAMKERLTAISSPAGTVFPASKFKEAVAALKKGDDIDFDGASGPVNVDAAGDVAAPYDMWKVEGGTIVFTEQGLNP